MRDVITKSDVKEFVQSMEQRRRLAVMMDAQIKLRRDSYQVELM